MNYLKQKAEMVIIQAVLEDNKRMNGIKPWWFYEQATSPLAWSIFKSINKRKKVNGDNVLQGVDWSKSRASEEEVRLVLEPMRKPEDLEDIIRWFKTKNRILELYENNLAKGWADEKKIRGMQKVSEHLKENYPDDRVYKGIMDLWIEHCATEMDIEHDAESRKKKIQAKIKHEQQLREKIKNKYGTGYTRRI